MTDPLLRLVDSPVVFGLSVADQVNEQGPLAVRLIEVVPPLQMIAFSGFVSTGFGIEMTVTCALLDGQGGIVSIIH